ncbi:MAG: methylmalonyl-CoA epimerase [Acidobacteriota bacterium]
MLKKLDHIGIVVKNIDEVLSAYQGGLGMKVAHREVVESEAAEVAFLPLGETRLELLEPKGAGGVLPRFLEKRGPGIHHLCFEVDDVRAALAALRAAGVPLVDEAPRPGAEGCQVAFVHPKGTGGVLIELSEKKHE